MDLHNRVVLVTGAARRIGRAIAERLAQAGCNIAVHAHQSRAEAERTAQACRGHGVKAEVLIADLQDPHAVEALVADTCDKLGGLDILINNAAVFEPMRLDDLTLADWDRTLRINLTAPALLAHAAREQLCRSHGRIINICDAATPRAWSDHLAYVVSKGGLETLTRALARALAPEVNVVGVAPGVAAWPEEYDADLRARLTARIPLQRAGSCADIAATVHFLLAEGDYVTGVVWPVDGGRGLC